MYYNRYIKKSVLFSSSLWLGKGEDSCFLGIYLSEKFALNLLYKHVKVLAKNLFYYILIFGLAVN